MNFDVAIRDAVGKWVKGLWQPVAFKLFFEFALQQEMQIDTCIRITESLFCTPETNTTLLINYTPI